MFKGSIEWERSPEEGLVLRIKPPSGGLFNGEIYKHMLAARKEMLIGLRNLIDIAVKRMEEKEKKAGERGTKIEVD